MKKSMDIQKVIEQNQIQEEQRKESIRDLQRKAEARKQELDIQRKKELDEKHRMLEEKERHSIEVRQQMEAREFNRIDHIKSKRQEKDSVMMKTQSQKDWDLMLKKEMDLIKREGKLDNVDRISKANEYKKQKVLEKIEYGNERSRALSQEKDKLLETRFVVRQEADKQKKQILEAFDVMKKKGKIDNNQLAKLGLDMSIKEDPVRESQAPKEDIEAVKAR